MYRSEHIEILCLLGHSDVGHSPSLRQLHVEAGNVPRLPARLLHQPHPELLPGCGYRPIARNAKRLLRVLDAQSLTDEQRARLKKDLFLE